MTPNNRDNLTVNLPCRAKTGRKRRNGYFPAMDTLRGNFADRSDPLEDSEEFDQAEEYLNLWIENGNTLSVNDSIHLAYLIKELGKEQEAFTILYNARNSVESQLNKNAGFSTYFTLARIHSILGEKDEALEYLSEAAKFGFEWGWQDFIEIDPTFENLQNNPKFQAIVKRAQSEKAAIRVQIREAEKRGEIDL